MISLRDVNWSITAHFGDRVQERTIPGVRNDRRGPCVAGGARSEHASAVELADIFEVVGDGKDLYWFSDRAIDVCRPSRGSEPASLMIDSLIEEDGRLFVRWFPKKEGGLDAKICACRVELLSAKHFSRLIKTRTVRPPDSLHNQGNIYAILDASPPDDFFGEDEPLNALQFAYARNSAKNRSLNLKCRGGQEINLMNQSSLHLPVAWINWPDKIRLIALPDPTQ